MTSEIRANTLKNRVGLGTVSFTNTGPVVSGIVTANTFRLPDATSGSLGRLQFGNGLDLSLYHNGSNSFLVNNTGYLSIQSQDGVNGIFIARNAEVNLYFGPSVRLQTSSSGVTINRDLDVDGHTNLDNVSIAGVTTVTGDLSITQNLVHTGDTDTKLQFNTDSILLNTAGTTRISASATEVNVTSTLKASKTGNNAGIRIHTNSGVSATDNVLRFNTGQTNGFTFHTNSDGTSSNERLRIASDGKVGIGSDIPVAHLDVAAYQNVEVLRLRDRHYNKYLTIRGGGSPNRMVIDSYEGGGGGAAIDLASNGDTKLRISSGGQVRMNTAGSPSADLHVGGTSAVLNSYFQTSSSTGAYHKYSLGDSGADLGYLGSARQISSSGQSAGFALRSQGHIEFCTGGSTERLRISSTGQIHLNGASSSTTGTSATDLLMANGAAIRFRKGDGSAWINTVGLDGSNNLKLGWGGSVDEIHFGIAGIGEQMTLDSSGNLLIGRTAWVDNHFDNGIYLAGSTQAGMKFMRTASGSAGTYDIGIDTDRAFKFVYAGDSGGTGTERLRIDSSGRVSINESTYYTQGQFTIKNTNDFSTASTSNNTDNIFLISDATSGDGVYGASIGFSRVQYPDRRAAAIATVQEGTDEDFVGLSFFTHDDANATDPVVEKLRIHASGNTQLYGGDLLLGPDSVSQMEATIRAWGCSLWFTTIDPNYYHDSGGEFRQFYNKGSFRGDNYLTAFDCPIQTGVGPQNRNFWRGANADTRAEGNLDISVGYRGAWFFIGQTSCASIPYNGNGRYLFDRSNARTSVSFDSFGSNIDSGELSFHAGSTAGYNSGNGTVGGRLGSSNSDSTLRMYCVGVNMENYNAPNSKRAGNHLGISVINDDGTDYGSSRLSENLINNSTTGGTNSATGEFNWGNRHSNDRGGTTTFRHSQLMYFDDVQLNSAQWDYLEHYFKVMYG